MAEDTAIVPSGEPKTPALPTYKTVADYLEKKNGSGIRLFGWTIARSFLIAPPMMLVGVPPKKAFLGAFLASGLISLFTLMRISNAADQALAAAHQRRAMQRYRQRR
jgi:hypothetical protein